MTDEDTERTADFTPKRKHRIEIGDDTTGGAFFTIAHPPSMFGGPAMASFDREEAREIYDVLDEFFGADDR